MAKTAQEMIMDVFAEIESDFRKRLGRILANIERYDEDYPKRYGLVLAAIDCAQRAGYQAGFRIDPDEPEWPVAYIELPTGQVSWHMPQHPNPWDGHSTEEKYRRCRAYKESM